MSNQKKPKAPKPNTLTVLRVYTASAGRCSFFGCPRYVLKESLTYSDAVLGNVAHIVGESTDGPRGNHPMTLPKRAEFENLMLMCTEHHAFIDKRENWDKYPVTLLKKWKKEHESRMMYQSGIPVTKKTHIIRLRGQIGGKKFPISQDQIVASVFKHEKRYVDPNFFNINLITVTDSCDAAYWKTCQDKIDDVLERQVFPLIEDGEVENISIFCLARIPLLAYLGYRLADKIPTTLYQKHKDEKEGWQWKRTRNSVSFTRIDHGGKDEERISILISISGGNIEHVKSLLPHNHAYEIRPTDIAPTHTLLKSSKTLENFRSAYRDFLSFVEKNHPNARQIDCFIAGPAPVAIICGRELRAEDPKVNIYNLFKDKYTKAITLN